MNAAALRRAKDQSAGSVERGIVDYEGKCPECGKWSSDRTSNVIQFHWVTCERCNTEFFVDTGKA